MNHVNRAIVAGFLASLVSAPVLAVTVPFIDGFNRPDGTVGNGWLPLTENIGENLTIQNNALTKLDYGGFSGIYRPISYTAPVTISATLTQTNGYGGTTNRYESGFLLGTTGSLASGYEVLFHRSESIAYNSSVAIYANGMSGSSVKLGQIYSPFQFGSSITPTVTYSPTNGQISGSVVSGAQSFSFNFGAIATTLPGSNIGLTLEGADNRSSLILKPTFDNVSITGALKSTPPIGSPVIQGVNSYLPLLEGKPLLQSLQQGYAVNPGKDSAIGQLEIYLGLQADGSLLKPIGNLTLKDANYQVPGFNSKQDTYVIVHGWCKECDPIDREVPDWVSAMAMAIKYTNPQANVIAYNWQREASFVEDPTTPLDLVPNEKVAAVSQDLVAELTSLARVTGGLGNLNLIGHSLGAAAIARVGGDASLGFNPINTTLSRLTLFDAPQERLLPGLGGGRVVLDEFVNSARKNFGVVENYIGDASDAFGVPYAGIANTKLNNASHSYESNYSQPPYSAQEWYLKTLVPELVSTGPRDQSQAELVGFNESSTSLLARYGELWSNGINAPSEGMFNLAPVMSTPIVGPLEYNSTPKYLGQIGSPLSFDSPFNFDCSVFQSAGSASCAQGTGLTLITHSPTWAFTNITVPWNVDAMSVFFRPGDWGDGDYFVVGVNEHLIYALLSDFFTNDLLSTGQLDLSLWVGQNVTLSFGFISDVADHWLSVERIQFWGSRESSVSEPSTMMLSVSAFLGLAVAIRQNRRKVERLAKRRVQQ